MTPLQKKAETVCTKLTSFAAAGISMLDTCVDTILMFWNRVDAIFGWLENPRCRSEQYWRRVAFYDEECADDEIQVWDTVMKKLKAPGTRGNLCVFIPPRTPFVQEDMEVYQYEIQRLPDPDPGHATCSSRCRTEVSGSFQRASTTVEKPKAPGKLGQLRIVVPATESFVEEARYANEYCKRKRAADKLLRQAIRHGLPSATPGELETLLSPTSSLYLNCDDNDGTPASSRYSSLAIQGRGRETSSIPCSGDNLDAQANDVWLDIYSQEAGRQKVSRDETETKATACDLAPTRNARVIFWANDLSPQRTGFWDQM